MLIYIFLLSILKISICKSSHKHKRSSNIDYLRDESTDTPVPEDTKEDEKVIKKVGKTIKNIYDRFKGKDEQQTPSTDPQGRGVPIKDTNGPSKVADQYYVRKEGNSIVIKTPEPKKEEKTDGGFLPRRDQSKEEQPKDQTVIIPMEHKHSHKKKRESSSYSEESTDESESDHKENRIDKPLRVVVRKPNESNEFILDKPHHSSKHSHSKKNKGHHKKHHKHSHSHCRKEKVPIIYE